MRLSGFPTGIRRGHTYNLGELEPAQNNQENSSRWLSSTPKQSPFVAVSDVKDVRLLEALLAGSTIDGAAEAAGISASYRFAALDFASFKA